MPFLSKIFGDANVRYIKSLQPIVDRINSLEPEFGKLASEELRAKSREFKNKLDQGQAIDDILPEAFAAVREAAKRTLNQRHFDVQLIGGVVLHRGKIAEMRTGEGKTLVATLPAYLNALTGKGVHIITVNDYLARRDAVWMGQIYNALGMSVGCINHDQSYLYDAEHRHEIQDGPKLKNEREQEDRERDSLGSFKVVYEFLRPVPKQEAYRADITYGTNNEYGFDYLRDNLIHDISQISQKEHNFAIVDEVDSILIDEARTPLIISAPDADSGDLYKTFARVAPQLKESEDYNVDEKLKAVSITETGIEKVEKALNLSNIYEEGGVRHVHHLEQALKAQILFKRDKDYVVNNGEVIIVDEFTGRLMPGRRWSQGLHQAIEAKEGVGIQKESRTLATITFQNYFRLYKKLAGMTGTARTSAEEFHKVYNLDAVMVPTNKPAIRQDLADRIYKTETGKFRAAAKEIKERHKKGQPVLVGTVSIEKNELLSKLLEREGVQHNVLNAKNHEREAEIIAQAGRLGAVTVATNMAGRGVDIILGGNPQNDSEQVRKVRELGGLHVIGTERHEARRIDDQLRGRAGRQGDPGSSQFFVSTEDDVIRVFGGDRLKNLMETLGVGEDDVIENRFISKAIEQAQSRIEGHNFDSRKYVLEYDDVMNKHRETIYGLRRQIINNSEPKAESLKFKVLEFIQKTVENIIDFHTQGENHQWDIKEIEESIKALANQDLRFTIYDLKEREEIKNKTLDFIKDIYGGKEKEVGAENMRQLEKFILLRTIDELWTDHIEAMEYLRDSVRLRAYGQRDPLVEYKTEGQKMFENLQNSIKVQVANLIFKASFIRQPPQTGTDGHRLEAGKTADDRHRMINRDSSPANNKPPAANQDIGRNDPCPCGAKNSDGSPKKYKKCHGA